MATPAPDPNVVSGKLKKFDTPWGDNPAIVIWLDNGKRATWTVSDNPWAGYSPLAQSTDAMVSCLKTVEIGEEITVRIEHTRYGTYVRAIIQPSCVN